MSMSEEGAIVSIIGGFFALFILAVITISYLANSYQCKQQYRDFNPSFGFVVGCMVEYKGQIIPAETLRFGDLQD